jgi:uncharacterized protein YeeX (DUF496 family)
MHIPQFFSIGTGYGYILRDFRNRYCHADMHYSTVHSVSDKNHKRKYEEKTSDKTHENNYISKKRALDKNMHAATNSSNA